MTMPHIQWANENGKSIAFIAELNDPEHLVNETTALAKRNHPASGRYALCSIAAHAHWLQINGHWVKK